MTTTLYLGNTTSGEDFAAMDAKQFGLTLVPVTAPPYKAATNGTTDARAAIVLAAAAATSATLYFPAGTYRIASDLTLSCACMFAPGAKLKRDTGVTITISGIVIAGPHQIFDITNTGNIRLTNCEFVMPQWFGALGDATTFDGLTGTDNLAAFNACHASLYNADDFWRGGEIWLGKGRFRFSNTWKITKHVVVKGAGAGFHKENAGTILLFPASVNGISCYSSFNSPDGGSGDFSVFQDFQVYCTNRVIPNPTLFDGVGDGIWTSAKIHIQRVVSQRFARDGFHIEASANIATGNANNWSIQDSHAASTGRDGFFYEGHDTNAGYSVNCQAHNVGRWGHYDGSVIANTHIAPLSEGAGRGAIKSAGGGSRWITPYIEGGTGMAVELTNNDFLDGEQINSPRVEIIGDGSAATARVVGVSGGALTSIMVTDGGTGYTTATAVLTFEGSGSGATLSCTVSGGQVTAVNVVSGGANYADIGVPVFFAVNGSEGGWSSNRGKFKNRLQGGRALDVTICDHANKIMTITPLGVRPVGGFDAIELLWNDSKGVVEWQAGGDVHAAAIRFVHPLSTVMTGGRSARLPRGSVDLSNGVWLGDGLGQLQDPNPANSRFIGVAGAMPAAGEWAQGDTVLYKDPSVQGLAGSRYTLFGWRRITSGSNNVLNTDWVEMRIPTGT